MDHNIRPAQAQQSKTSLPPTDLLILGAGRFGRIAAERLHKRYPKASFLVVDESPEKLGALSSSLAIPTATADCIEFLGQTLMSENLWVIPAVPVHVSFHWVLGQLSRKAAVTRLPVPSEVDHQIPNPLRLPTGTAYASYATFRCPDSCSEPADLCTHTKQPRLGNLFQDLASVSAPGFTMHVLRSLQLCPGVGGYTGNQLQLLLDEVARTPGRHLLATSCRCHCVIDALEWHPA